jgi:hypothetical protein
MHHSRTASLAQPPLVDLVVHLAMLDGHVKHLVLEDFPITVASSSRQSSIDGIASQNIMSIIEIVRSLIGFVCR